MADVDACSCSLQARLHQIENFRSREMKVHGELVQTLEHELEDRRAGEGELRLETAKLRSEICRLEAQVSSAQGKIRQLQSDQEAERAANAAREDEFKKVVAEKQCQLQQAHDRSDKLAQEKQQLNTELLSARVLIENSKRESENLVARLEEQRLAANVQAAEMQNLAALLSRSKHEAETFKLRNAQIHKELMNAQDQHNVLHGKLQGLERDVDRALIMRNRAIQWRQRRQEVCKSRLCYFEAFLAWKSAFLHAKLGHNRNEVQRNEDARARLKSLEDEVRKRCLLAKQQLNHARETCMNESARFRSLRDEICQNELPKMVGQFERQQECIQNQRERFDMSQQDVEHRVQKLLESHTDYLAQHKRQQTAIFRSFASERRRELQRRVFNAWKEFYLRSAVGQATHTAMVFKAQQALPTRNRPSGFDLGDPQSWAMPASIRPIPIDFLPPRSTRPGVVDPSTPSDFMWKKWRRIGSAGGRNGVKGTSPLKVH